MGHRFLRPDTKLDRPALRLVVGHIDDDHNRIRGRTEKEMNDVLEKGENLMTGWKMPKTPFHVGQPADDVLRVAKRTGRERLAVEFEHEGETFRFDLEAMTARERREKKEAMEAEVGDRRIRLDRLPRVRYFYADCSLTFEKTRGPSGDGALCYRVTEIGEAEEK